MDVNLRLFDERALSVAAYSQCLSSNRHSSGDGEQSSDGGADGDDVFDDGGDGTSSNFHRCYRSSNSHRWIPRETTCYCGDVSPPSPTVVP